MLVLLDRDWNIIAASRPQPLYKAGAKAENSHIDVQNLKTVLSL